MHMIQRLTQCTLLVVLTAGPAVADEIHADRVFREVTIRRFDGEVVVFVPRGAESMARKLRDIGQIRVDSIAGLEPFNQGEALFSKGDFAGAAQAYDRALPRARDFWKPLILVRYLMASNRGGDLAAASRTYIQLAQILPNKGYAFVPQDYARASEDQRRSALVVVERLFPDVANQEARWHVEIYRLSLMHSLNDPRSADLIEDIIRRMTDIGDSDVQWRLQMTALRLFVQGGAYAQAVPFLNRAIAAAPRNRLAELLFLKGRCLYEIGASRAERLQAAMAFMRCAIHFDDSPEAPAALLWAGRIHEELGRSQESVTLYQECLKMRQADETVLAEATAALERLGI